MTSTIRITSLNFHLSLALRCLALTGSMAVPGAAWSQARIIDIQAQPLRQAIESFQRQTGLEVKADRRWFEGRSAPEVKGQFEPRAALEQLLAASGLRIVSADSVSLQLAVTTTDPAVHELAPVVVTARRGLERSKDVPLSVSTVSGDDVERRRLVTLEEALRSAPGVDVSSFGGFGDTNVRMRGVGSLFQINAEDSSVVLNIDGVPLSSRSASLGTMDIERVEILKGPQGTLFGRNSEAGAVNIVSRRPTRKLEGYVRTEAGQEQQHLAEAAVGGPLTETFSARVALRGVRSDSPVINRADGNPVMQAREEGARLSLLWQPEPGTSVLAVSERQNQKGKVGFSVMRPYSEPPSIDATPGLQFADNREERHSIEASHDLSGSRLIALVSYTPSQSDSLSCYDRTLANAVFGMPMEVCQQVQVRARTSNVDLRLSSLAGDRVFWVAGVNASDTDRDYNNGVKLFGSSATRQFQTRSTAAYGEVTYPVQPSLKATAGLRYTRDRKNYQGQFVAATPTPPDSRHLADSYATGRIALMYELSPRVNLYGVAARGYKSGGFTDYSTQVADGVPLRAAVADSVELGFKSDSADRRVTLNGAVFTNRVRDDHLLGYDPLTFASIGLNTDTRSQGAEIEGTWHVDAGLSLSGGINFTDAEIKRDVLGASGGDVLAGNRVPDVARWGALLSVAYRTTLPAWGNLDSAPSLNASLTYRYLGRRTVDAQNHYDLGGYQKIDARVGVVVRDLEVFAWADNLLDKRYELYGYHYAPGVSAGMVSRGRTLGLGLNYQF